MTLRKRFRPLIVDIAGRAEAVARRHNWITPPPTVISGAAQGSDRRTEAESAPPTSQPLDNPDSRAFGDFNSMLHELRSIELARMPKTQGTILSAGASGTLYFNWISECYGSISRHIGLELYLPEPENLPAEVVWVKASVGKMTGVDTASVSLVFSGQNFEHLFGDDAVGFLLECHRVLTPGGVVVIDSPNREVASAANWTQPEHTIEFTPSEAKDLLTLAGFDVTSLRGLWLCVDPVTGERLELWESAGGDPSMKDVVRRSVLATDRPEGSFIWWLEAVRSEREPEEEALRRRHAEIFEKAWVERQQRLRHQVGERLEVDGKDVVFVRDGIEGYAMFGPYMPLVRGSYQVTFTIRASDRSLESAPATDLVVAEIDVADVAGAVLVSRELRAAELPAGEWTSLALSFDVPDVTWGAQFRVLSTGVTGLEVVFETRLFSDAEGLAPTPPL